MLAKDECKADQTRLDGLDYDLWTLEQAGIIESYQLLKTHAGYQRQDSSTRGGQRREATERYDRYQQWATRNRLQLGAGFRERELGTTRIEFPSLHLEARDNGEIHGVFPCVDKSAEHEVHEYSIEAYLNALEAERDWRTHRPQQPTQLTVTEHDAIQAHLKVHLEDEWPEWTHFETEYALSTSRETVRNARVDLVFKHDHEPERYLLVEVKPDRESVDKAFGQLLRYQHAFCDLHSTPNLTTDQIELAIAAPEIGEYHEKAAETLGVRLLEQVSN